MCRHRHYMRNEIQLSMQSKYSSNGQRRLKRLFSLSDRMICCSLSVLNRLKLLCFLSHLDKENCTDLHLSFGRDGSLGTVLSMESGNSDESHKQGRAGTRKHQHSGQIQSRALLSGPLGLSGHSPEGPGGMPEGRDARREGCPKGGMQQQHPGSGSLSVSSGKQEQNKEQKRGKQTCRRPQLLVIGLQPCQIKYNQADLSFPRLSQKGSVFWEKGLIFPPARAKVSEMERLMGHDGAQPQPGEKLLARKSRAETPLPCAAASRHSSSGRFCSFSHPNRPGLSRQHCPSSTGGFRPPKALG